MESNFAREFYNSALLSNSSSDDECLRQKIHFEQNKMHAIAISVAKVPICFAALVGNFAILVAIWKTPVLHSPANILLSSLAVSDFGAGLIAQPLIILLVLTGIYGLSPPVYCAINLAYRILLVQSFSLHNDSNCI